MAATINREDNQPRKAYWDAADVVRRLKRIEGQVRGIQAMMEREESCHAVLMQVQAVEGAIKQVNKIVTACSVAERLSRLDNMEDAERVRLALVDLLKQG